MATGFQVITQLGVPYKVHRLYVNQTLPDDRTSASVEVEESGEYLVSILPIVQGRGITNSDVEYWERVMINDTGKFWKEILYNSGKFMHDYLTHALLSTCAYISSGSKWGCLTVRGCLTMSIRLCVI